MQEKNALRLIRHRERLTKIINIDEHFNRRSELTKNNNN
jgi:hypothetical protein